MKLPAEMEGSAIVRGEHTFAGDAKTPPDAAASGARGLGTGHFYSQDGRMLATVVQEGLVWLR